jgi:predicted nucleic acid-binding protein
MTILDSNVVSALMNDFPENEVVAWVDREDRATIWLTSITILEIRSGLQAMPIGRKQTMLSERFERILDKIDHRVASFDEEAANLAANLMVTRRKKGRMVEVRDTMIAGIVLALSANLATRNTSHFDDIGAVVINPWTA